jgi:hypothetical protein
VCVPVRITPFQSCYSFPLPLASNFSLYFVFLISVSSSTFLESLRIRSAASVLNSSKGCYPAGEIERNLGRGDILLVVLSTSEFEMHMRSLEVARCMNVTCSAESISSRIKLFLLLFKQACVAAS